MMKQPVPEDFGLTKEDITLFESADLETPKYKLVLEGIVIIPVCTFFAIGLLGNILNIFIGAEAFVISAVLGLFLSFCFIEWKQIFRRRTRYFIEKRATYVLFKKKLGYFKAYLKAQETNRLKAERVELQKNHEYWFSLDGKSFEEALKCLLLNAKYSRVKLTPITGDHGVDLWATDPEGKVVIFQCKAHKKRIGPSAIRDLYGTFTSLKGTADYAVMVALADCTSGARTYAMQNGIRVWTITDLISLNNLSGSKIQSN